MKIDILYIAKLANLNLEKKEIKKFGEQLSSILDYIKKLQEVNTENISPTSQITDLENVVREDKSQLSLHQEEVLSNVQKKHNGFFKIKAIFE